MSNSPTFEHPQVRQLLVLVVLLQLGAVGIFLLSEMLIWPALDLTDPITTPITYLLVFGSCSLWVAWQYRRHEIDLRSLIGPWPFPIQWRAIAGLWLTLFIFSIGSFQVSYALLSFLFPGPVEVALRESIFLGAGETTFPWLYNTLFMGVLVIGAPVFEEFLFRGFLLHRWGTRWSPKVAVILSSLVFGLLHGNVIGLSVFGLAMALLYLRSRSLGLVVVVHGLNNAIAAGLEIVTRLLDIDSTTSLETFRANVGLGVLLLGLSTPLLIRFVWQNWQVTRAPLPYFAHRGNIPSP